MTTPTTLEIGAAYVRVSTDDQTELSPDAQIRVIMDAAKADGFIIPKEYIFIEKKGISGRKADNRPEFQRMIAFAKSQRPAPFKRLYLWKFSRFARNQEESTFYKGILRKKCGVEIKSVSEPIMEGMFGRLIETIIEWFDEYYSINLSGEVIRGMTEKALREGYQSTPCLGYRAVGEGKPFIVDEKSYAIVEYIFQTYHSGKDMTATARATNSKGYRTRRGNRFDRRGINRILTNRFYIGEVVWNGYTFQGTHEIRTSITSIFDDVQKRLEKEYRPQKRREVSSNAHWLSGMLKCSVCGSSLGYNRSNDQKKRPDFFQCWKYAKGFHEGSCCLSVRLAEKAVIESLEEVLATNELEYEYIRKTNDTVNAEEVAIQEALAHLEVKERRIREAYENEIDTLEEYKQNKLRLKSEREELMADAERLHRQAEQAPDVVPSKEDVMRQVAHVHEIISDSNIDYETKGNALRKIVKDIVFDRKKGHLYIHFYIS
ncbi:MULTISPECIES: recombinase family protein [unclassified Clostridium]|jgi:DNA invertase Pin-like site-specific DNA recombinase|uniref:recombinase family protein n=1 Tax=unclassified Clostridium TaxID=2614128 RepID=UPI00033710A3|nr:MULTISPECIES: recombinase family protein [unclassified Clostridium]CCY00513.1 resolvase domain protein [Enterocloster bolteae CAG:59]DAF65764.1 MAG TPA: integrase [Caudoviricetes sp.]